MFLKASFSTVIMLLKTKKKIFNLSLCLSLSLCLYGTKDGDEPRCRKGFRKKDIYIYIEMKYVLRLIIRRSWLFDVVSLLLLSSSLSFVLCARQTEKNVCCMYLLSLSTQYMLCKQAFCETVPTNIHTEIPNLYLCKKIQPTNQPNKQTNNEPEFQI